jgi:hypothetical protein
MFGRSMLVTLHSLNPNQSLKRHKTTIKPQKAYCYSRLEKNSIDAPRTVLPSNHVKNAAIRHDMRKVIV